MLQMDLLISRIIDKKNPTVAGLDTRLEYLPEKFLQAVCRTARKFNAKRGLKTRPDGARRM